MEYRILGNTGLKVSCVGFGGIVAMGMPQEDANRAVASAIERGVNYFDFAPMYGDCQERLGPALRGRRDDVILACKADERTREGAWKQLQDSLSKLETDHFDVYQLHGVPNFEELNTALGPGGAIEAFLEAREKGLVRFLGITVHSQEVALDAISRFDFDTILFPINFSYWHNCDAGPRILEEAAKKGMGRVAMKSMALRPWCDDQEHQAGKWKKTWYRPIDDPALVELAVRFTLSQDINVMLPPGHLELFEMAMKVAESFRPIEPSEVERLREVAAGLTPIFPTPESS